MPPLSTATLGPCLGLAALLVTGCWSATAEDMRVGDCLRMGGAADRPDAAKVACGSPDSTFRVVATVENSDECPGDVDSYYSMRSTFDDVTTTVCMDIDWVVSECMSIDPQGGRDPFRTPCDDTAVPHRQRATEILHHVADVDQCASGVGYAYGEREFTVCVEDIS